MYKVIIDQKEYSVTKDDLQKLDAITTDEGYHVIEKHRSTFGKATFELGNPKQGEVLIDNQKYEFKILDTIDQQVEAMGLNAKTEEKLTDVLAPMPGLIIDIMVNEGDTIEAGDSLLILEAMKMENVLKAAGSGVVKSIHFQKSDSVEKGALLIELE